MAVLRERAQQFGHVDATVQRRRTPFLGRHPILARARQRSLQLGPSIQVAYDYQLNRSRFSLDPS